MSFISDKEKMWDSDHDWSKTSQKPQGKNMGKDTYQK